MGWSIGNTIVFEAFIRTDKTIHELKDEILAMFPDDDVNASYNREDLQQEEGFALDVC
jgi:hypothetical protein